MRLSLTAAALVIGFASLAQAQTPLTGTTGPLTSTPPVTKTQPAVRRSLQQRFDTANTTHDGRLTLAQARAGMPKVAKNFAAIDTDHKAYVTKDEIQTYMRAHRAKVR